MAAVPALEIQNDGDRTGGNSAPGRISLLTWGVRTIIFFIIAWIYLFE